MDQRWHQQWYRFRIESHNGLFQSAIRLISKLQLIQRNAFIVANIDDGHESTRGIAVAVAL
jgi:hypothetical protein